MHRENPINSPYGPTDISPQGETKSLFGEGFRERNPDGCEEL